MDSFVVNKMGLLGEKEFILWVWDLQDENRHHFLPKQNEQTAAIKSYSPNGLVENIYLTKAIARRVVATFWRKTLQG